MALDKYRFRRTISAMMTAHAFGFYYFAFHNGLQPLAVRGA